MIVFAGEREKWLGSTRNHYDFFLNIHEHDELPMGWCIIVMEFCCATGVVVL